MRCSEKDGLMVMSNISNDIRIAVDTGKVSLGYKEVVRAIENNTARLVIIAQKSDKERIADIQHLCKVSGIKVIPYEDNSVELGAVCGKPYSVISLAVIEQGNSKILDY
jgi:large subunit ribosomal protein L30e